MAPSTISVGSANTAESVQKPIAIQFSRRFTLASLISLTAFITLVISFSSPYWLSSFKETYSTFIRLGLWDFCFKDFRHPYYQFVDKFNGCYWIYNAKYHNIRDWLQPGWFIFVQAMMVFGLLFSLFTLITLSIVVMLYFLRYQFILIGISSAFQFLTAFVLAIAVIVFRLMAFNRQWLEYPNFNHLDWAYYLAIVSLLVHCVSGALLLKEAIAAHQRRRKMNNLVYNMQPRSPRNFGRSISETTPMILYQPNESQKELQRQRASTSSISKMRDDELDNNGQQQWPHFTQV